VSGITEHDATLEAQIDPNGLASTYQFQLGKGCYPAICMVIVDIPLPVEDLPNDQGGQTVQLDLNSAGVTLSPNSQYYYSVVATNSAGEGHGNEKIFTTPSSETGGAETGGASNVSQTGASLSGVVTAWGWREATYDFEYGTSTSYGASVPSPPGVIGPRVTCGLPCGPPHSEQFPVSENLTELQPGTTYHYRLVSTTGGHTSYGQDATFTTSSSMPGSPTIDSESASNVTESDAVLEATINPGGQAVRYQFQLVSNSNEYRSEIVCPPNPGPPFVCTGEHIANALPLGFIGSGSEDRSVSLDLAGAGVTLQPGTTYHYRVVVARSVQTLDTITWQGPPVYGPDQTFTTPSPSVHPLDVSALSTTSVGSEIGTSNTSAGSGGSSSTSGVTPSSLKTIKPSSSTSAQKLTKALRACRKKPRRKQAACQRLAHQKYAAAAKKANRR
jgi:hypothetical protein